MPDKCPICHDSSARVERASGGRDAYTITCPRCGHYLISGTAAHSDLSKFGSRHLLSAIIRSRYEDGEKIELGYETFGHLLDSVTYPTDPFSKIDLLLGRVLKRSGRVDKAVSFNGDQDYPLLFAEDGQEFWFYVNKAIDIGLLERSSPGYRLSLQGWKRLSEINKAVVQSEQAFVAMWFDKSLDPAWESGFKPALTACGLSPMRIDLEEHNEKICDRIIAEIRRSGLMVADFTGQRGGVYFESGFAMGLGIPLIRTCRKDHVESLHFDTRQYNHVVWESSEELHQKLVNRVRATLPFTSLTK